MAHKAPEQVCRLVRYFSRDCDVFIHFDRKYDLTKQWLCTRRNQSTSKQLISWIKCLV